ncbi:MAG: 16S rRNA (uracil(1498)-N(3))-methyltransferase [Clostridia bacterium]|nr:16S rRNA (uracil(1498)-N(3))-methyltransferase [Clostridia bacterium]
MPRFFVPSSGFDGETVTVTGDDAFHMARSLRMAVGDTVTVCDMHGKEHLCRLESLRDDVCRMTILESRESDTESPVDVTLYMGYPKGDKLELVIQKAVELGACSIVPFFSERCVKQPRADREEKQNARQCRIAEEAAKQCGRGRIPSVGLPIPFSAVLQAAKDYDVTLFCYEGDGTRPLKEVLQAHRSAKRIAVIIGAEGGFSLAEAEAAVAAGCESVGLGRRILRCETAPLCVLSGISYEFEL